MKFARVERIDGGYFIDPQPYLVALEEFKDQLPEGARLFATNPAHYDFSSTSCIKDLKLSEVSVRDGTDSISVHIRFSPSAFKHYAGLEVVYANVVKLSINAIAPARLGTGTDAHRLGDLQLDELLPHEDGCSHEIVLTGGSILVVASDLTAEWTEEVKPG